MLLNGPPIQHPEILGCLAAAGHGSKVLIADGNYPASTTLGRNAKLINLNVASGLLTATSILEQLVKSIPIEHSAIMDTLRSGPNAMDHDPEIWSEFEAILENATDYSSPMERIERNLFYKTASSDDVALIIHSGEQRTYANILLTIGVVRPE